MGWTGTEQKNVNWGSWTAKKTYTANHFKAIIRARAGRKTNGGNKFYIQVETIYDYGSLGDYRNTPGLYWYTTHGTDAASEKSALFKRADSPGPNSYNKYYIGNDYGNPASSINVGVSGDSDHDDAVVVKPALIAATYSVKYSANGGTTSSTDMTDSKTKGSSYTTKSGSAFSCNGYNFAGWNTAANGSGTLYQANYVYPEGQFPNCNVTLYAQWQPKEYAVSYNGNENTGGSTASQTKYYNTALTLRANGFTKTGYTFTGWNTNAAGTGTAYQQGGSYTGNANLTLYAQWKKNNIPLYTSKNQNILQIDKAYTSVNGEIKEVTVYTSVNGEIKTLI